MSTNIIPLINGVTRIYKSLQKLKKYHTSQIGLSGPHLVITYALLYHPEGLTGAELSKICIEDKAAISRTLSDMEENNLIYYENSTDHRKYRAKAFLTEEGKRYAERIHQSIKEAFAYLPTASTPEEIAVFYKILADIADRTELVVESFSTPQINKDQFLNRVILSLVSSFLMFYNLDIIYSKENEKER